ncbi:MAG TPA: hypothetical protein O0X14_03380 [Methanocorpusculum sp.]|nr:hypothetical protein [Methanocorpusculum sp.]
MNRWFKILVFACSMFLGGADADTLPPVWSINGGSYYSGINKTTYTSGNTGVSVSGQIINMARYARLFLSVEGSGVLTFKAKGKRSHYYGPQMCYEYDGTKIGSVNSEKYYSYTIDIPEEGSHTIFWNVSWYDDDSWGNLTDVQWNGVPIPVSSEEIGDEGLDDVMITNLVVTGLSPWGVKIDYEILSENHSDYLVNFNLDNHQILNNETKAVIGDTSATLGKHSVLCDLTKSGSRLRLDKANIKVTAQKQLSKFCVIDLSPGPLAEKYNVSYFDEEPEQWGDEYRLSKLVLKRIEPGSYMMMENGVIQNCGTTLVTLTKPFYFAVFELTNSQYELITGDILSGVVSTDSNYNITYDQTRGDTDAFDIAKTFEVSSDSIIGKLREKTGLGFDLPTFAQWEYVMRAGTDSGLVSEPNLWGIYQLNNVNTIPNETGREWCLDYCWYNGIRDSGGLCYCAYRLPGTLDPICRNRRYDISYHVAASLAENGNVTYVYDYLNPVANIEKCALRLALVVSK